MIWIKMFHLSVKCSKELTPKERTASISRLLKQLVDSRTYKIQWENWVEFRLYVNLACTTSSLFSIHCTVYSRKQITSTLNYSLNKTVFKEDGASSIMNESSYDVNNTKYWVRISNWSFMIIKILAKNDRFITI